MRTVVVHHPFETPHNATTIRDRFSIPDAIIERPVRAAVWRGLVIVDRVTERAFCAALPDRPPLALPDHGRVEVPSDDVAMGASGPAISGTPGAYRTGVRGSLAATTRARSVSDPVLTAK